MEYKRITLRIPEKLHENLMIISSKKSTSMNAEIIHRLENSFKNSELSEKQLMPANEAKKKSSEEVHSIYCYMVGKVVDEVERRVKLGKLDAYIEMDELEIDYEEDPLLDTVIKPLFKSLQECGYSISDSWDASGFHIGWDK